MPVAGHLGREPGDDRRRKHVMDPERRHACMERNDPHTFEQNCKIDVIFFKDSLQWPKSTLILSLSSEYRSGQKDNINLWGNQGHVCRKKRQTSVVKRKSIPLQTTLLPPLPSYSPLHVTTPAAFKPNRIAVLLPRTADTKRSQTM